MSASHLTFFYKIRGFYHIKQHEIYSLCLGITGYNVTPNNQGKLTASLTKSKVMELTMLSAAIQQQQMQQQMQQQQIIYI